MYTRFIGIVCALLLNGAVLAQETSINATAYGTVNVRSGPGVRYEIVGQISADEQVIVTGRDSDTSGWLRVMLEDGIIGWVASFAVLLDGDAADLPLAVTGDQPDNGDTPPLVTAYGRVNVRGGPGMEYEIVSQLDVDDTAAITGRNNEENDWLYIENDGLSGWVAYFTVSIQGNLNDLPVLVVPGSGEGVALVEDVAMTRFNMRLRSQPNFSSNVLEIVPFQTNVTPLARSTDNQWIYVEYLNTRGWGAVSLLDMTDEQIEALPPFNRVLTITSTAVPTPAPETTPNPDAEG